MKRGEFWLSADVVCYPTIQANRAARGVLCPTVNDKGLIMIRLFGLMLVLALTGCPDSDDADGADSGAGAQGGEGGGAGGDGGMGGGGGLCDVFDCGPGGTCVEVGGLPACECDPGFMLQG